MELNQDTNLYDGFTKGLYKVTPTNTAGTYEIAPDRLTQGDLLIQMDVGSTGDKSMHIDKLGRHWSGAALFENAPFSVDEFGDTTIGGTLVTLTSITTLQATMDALSASGGGTILLTPGTYTATSSFTIPSNVTLDGNGSTIDFGGGAYQILIQGTDAYSTGTVSVTFGSATITGSGTTWTAGMVGQSILLGDYWYEITAFGSTTSITIGTTFMGEDLSGDIYVIATTVDGTGIARLILQNSSISLFKFRYCNVIRVEAFSCIDGNVGIDGADSANVNWIDGSYVDSCVTGVLYNNVPFCVFDNYLISNCTTAMDLTRVSNTVMGVFSLQAITGIGVKFTNCYDLGVVNYAMIQVGSHGIEFVSGNRDMQITIGYLSRIGGDGIKLTATSDTVQINDNNFNNCTGYGINIAASTCDNNILTLNSFNNNTSGNINDNGTGTQIN